MPLQKMSGIFDTVSWNCWWQSELMVRSNLSYWYDPPPSPFCSPPQGVEDKWGESGCRQRGVSVAGAVSESGGL